LSALKKDSTNHKKRSIGIAMVAAAFALLLVAGTILSPIQSYAAPSTNGGIPNTSSLKHTIRDGVNVNLEHRDQHMDQENLCYRANTCRDSNVGQNTLGNDNSVTGFADQSDNIQQSAAPTAANQTTANQTTPTPTPTTATLTVIKIVAGNATNATASDFTIHVTGNNPTPANFDGSTTGIVVTLGSGSFNVTETVPVGSFFTTTTTGDCTGTIAAGQHLTCTITNTPKTCEECFTSLLTPDQITALLPFVGGQPSIADLCVDLATGRVVLSEAGLVNALTSAGVSLTTANELIACLKAAGIVLGL
jgi:hypothetical protein